MAEPPTRGTAPPDGTEVAVHATHETPDERHAAGRGLRKEVPRSAHAELVTAPDRPDPVAVLEEQAATRIPELIPIRYGRMLVSPFTFYRGAAKIMAGDLAGGPTTGLRAQLCGDAHLMNFGVFGSPERRLVFDLNDFDETQAGPFEWDVKRLAASVEIAGRDRGFDDDDRTATVRATVAAYREAMAEFAAMGNLELWYTHLDVDDALAALGDRLTRRTRRRAEKNLAKARGKDSLRAFGRLTTMVDGEPQIQADPPLVVPAADLLGVERDEALRGGLGSLLPGYRGTLSDDRRHLLDSYRLVDMARKVVGVGSVGTRAWIVLLLGRDGGDPLFLQAKEAQPSVLDGLAGTSPYQYEGRRVVVGQRIMQAASDIFLGWDRLTGDRTADGRDYDYYLRQLADMKGSARVDRMDPSELSNYARLCGWTLARAHARSGDRIAISGYLGRGDGFDRAIATFASAYADQNERDHAALASAAAEGRITVEDG